MILKKMEKKGVSLLIGYVLLTVIVIIMGVVIQQWVKTYIPADIMKCPEGASLIIKDIGCYNISERYEMNLTLKNNGRFKMGGYFIYGANVSDGFATIDLSSNLTEQSGFKIDNVIMFSGGNANFLEPGEEVKHYYNLSDNSLKLIQITPVRLQEDENKNVIVVCGDIKVNDYVSCEDI